MRKRKEITENNILVFKSNVVRITKESKNEFFFEIKNVITTDLAEAVAIMMMVDVNDVWDIEIEFTNEIDTQKCLYWLTGGNKEWSLLEHYNTSWVDCYSEFQEEFGDKVEEIVKKSKTLSDIKFGFKKYLNLPILYDFALSKGLVK
jgi:hypothetical protein